MAGAGWTISGKLTGWPQIVGKLDGLKNAVRNRIMRRAANDAARLVLAAVRPAVPVQTGAYRKSLAVKVKTYKDSSVTVAIIGPRSGYTRTAEVEGPRGKYKVIRKPTYYAHLIELGVKPHTLGKGSRLSRKTRKGQSQAVQTGAQHPGFVGKRPLTKAWESSKGQAAQALADRVAAEVARL